jgi:nucleotide-binding universal stress UspA family protein
MSQPEIVVGVDGSKAAENALLWAAAEALRRGARLLIAYAGDTELAAPPRQYEAARSGRTLLATSQALVSDNGLRCEVETLCRDQPAVAMLSELGKDADLLVVGSHGMARNNCSSLGSVAYGVAAHVPCPVAVIGPWPLSGTVSMDDDRPVTVGITANSTADPALELAFAEAALRQVPVKAVHSWAVDWQEVAAMAKLRPTGHALRAYHETRLASILTSLRQRYPHITVELCVSGKPVAMTLASASQGSSMLVLGRRHPRKSKDPLASRLGPTATRLIHVSQCPVVLVGSSPVAAAADVVDAGLPLSSKA